MENKTLRKIPILTWGIVFCLNLAIVLWMPDPHPLSWILVGFPLGCILTLLLDNPIMNAQDRFIKFLRGYVDAMNKSIKEYCKIIEKLEDIIKKLKGGKKKK